MIKDFKSNKISEKKIVLDNQSVINFKFKVFL